MPQIGIRFSATTVASAERFHARFRPVLLPRRAGPTIVPDGTARATRNAGTARGVASENTGTPRGRPEHPATGPVLRSDGQHQPAAAEGAGGPDEAEAGAEEQLWRRHVAAGREQFGR